MTALAKNEKRRKKWMRLNASERGEKKRERERHGWEKGMLWNTEIWKEKREASEEMERQEWSVKEGEVEQKMRQGAGGLE